MFGLRTLMGHFVLWVAYNKTHIGYAKDFTANDLSVKQKALSTSRINFSPFEPMC